MIATFFRRILSSQTDPRDLAAQALYQKIVARSRLEVFFDQLGVPDSVEGRFELIALHGFAVIGRLKEQGEEADAFNQRLFDTMFADIDDNLRELGVSDLKVGTRVKKMAQSFYGRSVAYENGLESADSAILDDAIARNVYATTNPQAGQVAAIGRYLRGVCAELSSQPVEAVMAGDVDFGPVPDAALLETE